MPRATATLLKICVLSTSENRILGVSFELILGQATYSEGEKRNTIGEFSCRSTSNGGSNQFFPLNLTQFLFLRQHLCHMAFVLGGPIFPSIVSQDDQRGTLLTLCISGKASWTHLTVCNKLVYLIWKLTPPHSPTSELCKTFSFLKLQKQHKGWIFHYDCYLEVALVLDSGLPLMSKFSYSVHTNTWNIHAHSQLLGDFSNAYF